MHVKSQAKGRARAGVAALVGLLALGAPGIARAQLVDRLRLPPLPQVPDVIGLLGSILTCVPESLNCRAGFECCDPCAARADGTYCGDDLFPPGQADVRYFCRDGQTLGTASCSQTCEAGKCVDPGGGGIDPS